LKSVDKTQKGARGGALASSPVTALSRAYIRMRSAKHVP